MASRHPFSYKPPEDSLGFAVGSRHASILPLQGFFESNILQALTYVEDATVTNAAVPTYIINGIAQEIA
jgi:hypothetical protein